MLANVLGMLYTLINKEVTMKIEVLGTGCAKCKKLFQLVETVVANTGLDDITLSKIEKLDEIMKHGITSTPALVIDGTIKASGSIPKPAQIAAWLNEERANKG